MYRDSPMVQTDTIRQVLSPRVVWPHPVKRFTYGKVLSEKITLDQIEKIAQCDPGLRESSMLAKLYVSGVFPQGRIGRRVYVSLNFQQIT